MRVLKLISAGTRHAWGRNVNSSHGVFDAIVC